MIDPDALLETCREGVAKARALGADQVEVFAHSGRTANVELQKDDIHTASTEDETSFGVRVFTRHSQGFATVNGRAHLADACAEALSIARVTPADETSGLAGPQPVQPLDAPIDPAIGGLDITALVERAAELLQGVRALDPRVRVDSGQLAARVSSRAVATSTGIALCEPSASLDGALLGMAVDGDEVGSFAIKGFAIPRAADWEAALEELRSDFATRCAGALGARKGESFRGTVLLTPEVVGSFLLGNLLPVLSAANVRKGRSPLGDRRGQEVASPALTLVDDARLAGSMARAAFDREGTPTGRTTLLERGVLQGFLYDTYEARAAGARATGHARGGATSLPSIGPGHLSLEPGDTALEALRREPERAIEVTRFSGSSSPITGEFSGVVKGGFLLHRGERTPVRETLIAGNLYALLRSVSGVSKELRNVYGRASLPTLRVEDVAVTAG